MDRLDPARIALLNDTLRQSRTGGRLVATSGVHDQGRLFLAATMEKLAGPFSSISGDDPYGERDFGTLTVFGIKLFWKIDYYDESLTSAATDPTDPSSCRRILTLMLAEEY